jgi:hypothetical protein
VHWRAAQSRRIGTHLRCPPAYEPDIPPDDGARKLVQPTEPHSGARHARVSARLPIEGGASAVEAIGTCARDGGLIIVVEIKRDRQSAADQPWSTCRALADAGRGWPPPHGFRWERDPLLVFQ